MISKLPTFGIYPSLCDLLTNFLSGRSIAAVVDGHRSSFKSINSDVPQGSVLGPLLFILYMAGIPSLFPNHSAIGHLFADDVQVYVHGPPLLNSFLLVTLTLFPRISICGCPQIAFL